MLSVTRVKFSSDMGGLSSRVRSSTYPSALTFNPFFLIEEEPKPVKLMLRALPLIQTHVRNILAASVAPE
jgi:hypothetical protein